MVRIECYWKRNTFMFVQKVHISEEGTHQDWCVTRLEWQPFNTHLSCRSTKTLLVTINQICLCYCFDFGVEVPIIICCRQQIKLREGIVFTPVYQPFCSGDLHLGLGGPASGSGGVRPLDTSPGQTTPLDRHPPGRHTPPPPRWP